MRAAGCRKLLNQWLKDGNFDLQLPEVAALRGVAQPEEFHSEGDALDHTMLAVAEVDMLADPRVFWGVLLHDIGKASTTEFIKGHWHAYGHAAVGATLVPAIMARIGFPELASDVAWLVREHMFHHSWRLREDGTLTKAQRRFMELPLFPLLLEVCIADAAASHGTSVKQHRILLLWELYREEIAGEKWPLD